MRFLALNSFAPPDTAPTARLLGDAAFEFQRRGHEINFVSIAASYRDSKRSSRALSEAVSLVKLLWAGITAPRPQRVLCLTTPPMLPVVGALVALRHRVPLIHWAMDIYPDVAVALGEVKAGSLLEKISRKCAQWAYLRCDQIIALDEDMVSIFKERYNVEAVALQPWPPEITGSKSSRFRSKPKITWLYSGNLGRAHEWKTLLEAQKLLEESDSEYKLVIQGRGAERHEAQQYARTMGLQNVVWKDYVDEIDLLDSLQQANALVATQRPETLGCLWPSKLALAALVGRPLLWIGPANGSVADWVNTLPHGHVFTLGDAAGIAAFLKTNTPTNLTDPTDRINRARETGIAQWADLILRQ